MRHHATSHTELFRYKILRFQIIKIQSLAEGLPTPFIKDEAVEFSTDNEGSLIERTELKEELGSIVRGAV